MSLSAGAILALLLLWQWQRSHPHFDLSDMITGDNGKVSATKFMQTVVFIVATWGFITMVQQGKLTEWYMAAYLGIPLGFRVWKESIAKT
jgi:hypothetical protein